MEEYSRANRLASMESKLDLFIIWTQEFTMTRTWNKEYSMTVVFGINTILSMRT